MPTPCCEPESAMGAQDLYTELVSVIGDVNADVYDIHKVVDMLGKFKTFLEENHGVS